MKKKEGLRFDWYQPTDAEFIDELAATVIDVVNEKRSTRGLTPEQAIARAEEEQLIAKHLIGSLYHAHSSITSDNSPTPIVIPKAKESYAKNSGDSAKVNYSYRYLNNVYKALIELKWIEVSIGVEYTGYTRAYASGQLAKTFSRIGLVWTKQQPIDESGLVVLRDREKLTSSTPNSKRPGKNKEYRKFDIPTPDSPEVRQMARNLHSYNDVLTKHCVSFNLPDSKILKIAKDMAGREDTRKMSLIDFSRTQVRRIFSRGSMSIGGRLYGGWWQSIPSVYRPHIMIDDHLTCEVDFSTISLRIIYASVGESIDPEADLYDIGLTGWSGEDDPRRKSIKVFVNAMMNDERGNFRLPKTTLDSIGLTHEKLKAKVLDCHSKIAEKLTDGVGLSTQLLDSQIAERVILSMLAHDILVLPIHDSFIVRRGMEQHLKMTMQNIFEQATGSRGKVSTEYLRSSKQFGITKGEIEAEILKIKEDPSWGIISTDDVFRAILSQEPDNNEDYLNSWREWSQVPPKRLWLSESQYKDVIDYLRSPFSQTLINIL
jgi:hypothetical protein